jgi:Ca-activated chloride channel family protein
VNRLAAAAAALLAGASPFQAEQPRVREGNERLLSGDAAGALERYQAAEQEAGAHPEIDFDRGDALHAQGRHAEAVEAWRKAAERGSAAFASRALQNTGNALDAAGDQDGARRALAEALRRDPDNEDARYNLEVLLRRKAAQGKPGESGDRKDQGPGKTAPQPAAGQPGAGQPPPEQPPAPTPGDAGEKEPQRAREDHDGAAPEGRHGPPRPGDHEGDGRAPELGRQDALRLLDALRARERNMPLEPTPRKDGRRRDVEKDW